MKRLWDAANAALDVIDAEIAQGLPEPEWAAQLREVIALRKVRISGEILLG
ncbi:hypothetical protein ACTLM4_026120 (plasmid) [Klebsiella pneumoniae]